MRTQAIWSIFKLTFFHSGVHFSWIFSIIYIMWTQEPLKIINLFSWYSFKTSIFTNTNSWVTRSLTRYITYSKTRDGLCIKRQCVCVCSTLRDKLREWARLMASCWEGRWGATIKTTQTPCHRNKKQNGGHNLYWTSLITRARHGLCSSTWIKNIFKELHILAF